MKIYQEAERFVNEAFYSGTYDSASKLRLGDMVNAKLEADNAAKDPEYYGHRDGVVHVSSLYGCVRGLIHQAIGSPKTSVIETRKLGIFKAGNLFEDFVVDSLGAMVLNRQTEYLYKHKGIVVTGRDDGLLLHEGQYRLLEAKSVHSDSFWYRQREGVLVQWHNQMQLTTYLWLRRHLPFVYIFKNDKTGEEGEVYSNMSAEEVTTYKKGNTFVRQIEKPAFVNNLGGIFSYISKDDCTVESAPVKLNMGIIEEIVIPVLDMVDAGYSKVLPFIEAKRSMVAENAPAEAVEAAQEKINEVIRGCAPAPELAVYAEQKKQWQINWLCKYNDYADHCYGKGWLLEAGDIVKRKNAEAKGQSFASTVDAVKNGGQ